MGLAPRRRSPERNIDSIVITAVQALVKARFNDGCSYVVNRLRDLFGPARCLWRAKNRQDAMNHSMYSADRRTHLKIVVIGLLCATLVAAVGIFAHVSDRVGGVDLGTAPLVKAGQPTTVSGGLPAIR
jgi:hypothetical protein